MQSNIINSGIYGQAPAGYTLDGRRVYARVKVRKEAGEYIASLVGPQGSGILTSMAQANGLMIGPEDVRAVKAGDEVTVQMLDWDEET